MKGVTQEEIVSITRQPLLDSMTPGVIIIIIIAEKCLTTKNTKSHQQTGLMLIDTPCSFIIFLSAPTHLLGVRFDST